MRRLPAIPVVLGLLALLFAGAPALSQEEEAPPRRERTRAESGDDVASPTREEILRRNHEIWNRMTPEQRARALERLKRFQKMSVAERRKLLEKARRLVGKLDRETRERISKKKRRDEYRRAFRDMKELLGKVRQRLPDDLKTWIAALDRGEQHMIERLVASRLFEAHAEIARKSLDEKQRARLAKASSSDRHRYRHLLFERYKKSILRGMPEREKARIEALPPAEQRKARHEYTKKVIGRRLVDLVSRTVVPDLAKLKEMPEAERKKLIRSRMGRHKASRRGPMGLVGYPPLTPEEQAKLREMPDTEKRAYFTGRLFRFLGSKGVPDEEIQRLRELPRHRICGELWKTHPELFEGAPRRQGRSGRRGGPPRGPHRSGRGEGREGGDR